MAASLPSPPSPFVIREGSAFNSAKASTAKTRTWKRTTEAQRGPRWPEAARRRGQQKTWRAENTTRLAGNRIGECCLGLSNTTGWLKIIAGLRPRNEPHAGPQRAEWTQISAELFPFLPLRFAPNRVYF